MFLNVCIVIILILIGFLMFSMCAIQKTKKERSDEKSNSIAITKNPRYRIVSNINSAFLKDLDAAIEKARNDMLREKL